MEKKSMVFTTSSGGGGGGVGTAPNPYQDSQELYWYTMSWSLCSIAMLAVGVVLGMGFGMYLGVRTRGHVPSAWKAS